MFWKINICIKQFSPSTCVFLKTNRNPSNIYPNSNLQSKMTVILKYCVTLIHWFSEKGFTLCDDKCAIMSCWENRYFAQICGILAPSSLCITSFQEKKIRPRVIVTCPRSRSQRTSGGVLGKTSTPDPQASGISMAACSFYWVCVCACLNVHTYVCK